ncbi:MAG: cohesin domain-containing protein [archaeon]|nr:cohesin domain-containing protein [archaeon]
MRRTLAISTALFLILTVGVSAQLIIAVTLDAPTSAGTSFDLEINTGEVSNLKTAEFTVSHGSEIEIASVSAGDYTSNAEIIFNEQTNSVLMTLPGSVSGSGTLAVISFNVLSQGSPEMSLEGILLGDDTGGEISSVFGGVISIGVGGAAAVERVEQEVDTDALEEALLAELLGDGEDTADTTEEQSGSDEEPSAGIPATYYIIGGVLLGLAYFLYSRSKK